MHIANTHLEGILLSVRKRHQETRYITAPITNSYQVPNSHHTPESRIGPIKQGLGYAGIFPSSPVAISSQVLHL